MHACRAGFDGQLRFCLRGQAVESGSYGEIGIACRQDEMEGYLERAVAGDFDLGLQGLQQGLLVRSRIRRGRLALFQLEVIDPDALGGVLSRDQEREVAIRLGRLESHPDPLPSTVGGREAQAVLPGAAAADPGDARIVGPDIGAERVGLAGLQGDGLFGVEQAVDMGAEGGAVGQPERAFAGVGPPGIDAAGRVGVAAVPDPVLRHALAVDGFEA